MKNFYIADEDTYCCSESIESPTENYFNEEQFYEDVFENFYEFDKELSFQIP